MTLSSWTKARRRRKLPALFREWAVLSEEASHIDKLITEALKLVCMILLAFFTLAKPEPSVFFLLWVLDKSSSTMLAYLEIGFDLELYDEQEYLMIYWYVKKATLLI